MWFAAHVVMWLRFKDGPQPYFAAEENILLIEAASDEEAAGRAEAIAIERYVGYDSGSLMCDNRPAERVFGGIRRLIPCDITAEMPTDGTEITYQFLLVESRQEFEALLRGDDARVLLKEYNDASGESD